MPTVRFGNPAGRDGDRVMDGERVTEATLPEGWTAAQRFASVTAPDGIWRNQSGTSAPVWVESDDTDLAHALSTHYGCPVGWPSPGEGE